MKRIFVLLFIVFILIAALAGCTDEGGSRQSPGVDYAPGQQENLNNYNNGLSMQDGLAPGLPNNIS